MHPRTRNAPQRPHLRGAKGNSWKTSAVCRGKANLLCAFRSCHQLVLCYLSNGFLLVTNSPTVEMESPKVETCLSNCTSPTVYTPDSLPTPTNLKPLSLTNSTSHVDERFRRRAISGLLCFFAVGWGDASEYILSFCFLCLIESFSNWGSDPLHPRRILSWLHSCFSALRDRFCWASPSYLRPTLGLILPLDISARPSSSHLSMSTSRGSPSMPQIGYLSCATLSTVVLN